MNLSIPKNFTSLLLLLLPAFGLQAHPAVSHPRLNTCTIGASAFVSGTLGCINTSVLLRGNSPAAGVTYSWSGPNGFTSTSQNVTVQAPGVYSLIATSPAGCTGTATVTVIQNVVPPANLVATTLSGSTNLNCDGATQTLSASSSTGGTSYSWVYQNSVIASSPTTTINQAGGYALIGTNPVNGCADTALISITNQRKFIGLYAATVMWSLTCSRTSAPMQAFFFQGSDLQNVVYNWTGPNGFTANTPAITVYAGGRYDFIATDTTTGCSDHIYLTEVADTVRPIITATNSGPITCRTYDATLNASSTAPNMFYYWTGPNGFISDGERQIVVDVAGEYILHADNEQNDCPAEPVTTIVADNVVFPTPTASTSGFLSCSVPVVAVIGGSDAANATYNWTGPNGFSVDSATAHTSVPGYYTLMVTDISNECYSSVQINVGSIPCPGARQTIVSSNGSNRESDIPGGVSFSAYPNPYREKTLISFQSPTADIVNIQVYNNSGSLEKTLFNNKVLPGQPYQLSLSALPAGMHLVVIRINNQVYTRKLIAL